jgi:2-polyprenyl-6-methoxyphenol hydroxylase-like FAD-dependent oxidoreductase
MPEKRTAVCIVGGGPVGLLTALRLGQAGVKTIVLEAHEKVLPTTRAVV